MKIPAIVCALIARGLLAQFFEVATVKLSGPQDRLIAMFTYPGGRVTIEDLEAFLARLSENVEQHQLGMGVFGEVKGLLNG